jgi:hypothetical protein
MGTLHEDLCAFLHWEVTGWGGLRVLIKLRATPVKILKPARQVKGEE